MGTSHFVYINFIAMLCITFSMVNLGSSDFTNGVTSGTTPQLGGEGVFPTVISGGGNNGNGASNTNGAGISYFFLLV